MKKLLLTMILAFSSVATFAANPALDPALKNVSECLKSNQVILCNSELLNLLINVNLDARGEFAIYLREELKANPTTKVIENLFSFLPDIVGLYEKLDTNANWSYRAIKTFQDDVAIEFVKISPIDTEFLVGLYKSQGNINSRYGLLTTLGGKIPSLKTTEEMDKLIRFLEAAKNHSRAIGDEPYLYNTAVDLIGQVTVRAGLIRPGHEGIYNVVFENTEAAKILNIDRLIVMEGNAKDSLVVSFVASKSRIVKVSFTAAAMLGETIFSNMDTYNDNQNTSNPYFKFVLNRENSTISGVFSTARHGELKFSGRMVSSASSVYALKTVKGLNLDDLIGTYKVSVGNYDMELVIKKRSEDRSVVEAALFNDNAMITFSKVSLNSDKGILSLVDHNNEKKLTLAIVNNDNFPVLKGQFLNAPQSKVLEVTSK